MRHFILIIVIALLGACNSAGSEQVPSDPIVTSYVAAYNGQDLDAMAALMHPDIQWLSIRGDEIDIVADGKADLMSQLGPYMSGETRSSIGGILADGNYRAVQEIAHWTSADGDPKSQSALAVYELEDGLIRRVWYYPETQ